MAAMLLFYILQKNYYNITFSGHMMLVLLILQKFVWLSCWYYWW